jgi:hypothetical protein
MTSLQQAVATETVETEVLPATNGNGASAAPDSNGVAVQYVAVQLNGAASSNGNGNGNGHATSNGNGAAAASLNVIEEPVPALAAAASLNGNGKPAAVAAADTVVASVDVSSKPAAAAAASLNGNGKPAAAVVAAVAVAAPAARDKLLNTIDEDQNMEAAGKLELAAVTESAAGSGQRTAAGTPYKNPGGRWSKFKTYSVWQVGVSLRVSRAGHTARCREGRALQQLGSTGRVCVLWHGWR